MDLQAGSSWSPEPAGGSAERFGRIDRFRHQNPVCAVPSTITPSLAGLSVWLSERTPSQRRP
jgi:hypothetical protein